MRRGKQSNLQGFGLLESIVTLGVVSIVLAVILAVTQATLLQRNAEHRAIARQLLTEEAEALRSASFSFVENRTNTPFIEVAHNRGNWAVAAPASPQTSPNVYRVTNASGANDPSRQAVPTGMLVDGTFQWSFRVDASSPGGWKTGAYIHYHDERNHYLVRVSSTNVEFVEVVEATETIRLSVNTAFSTGVWYRLTVQAVGTSYAIALNGSPLAGSPVTNAIFPQGYFVLAAFAGATVDFDSVSYTDLSITDTTVLTWNFDGVTEKLGAAARTWIRLNPSLLPSGSTAITITDTEPSDTSLKTAVLTVSWQERSGTRTMSTTVYLNEKSLKP